MPQAYRMKDSEMASQSKPYKPYKVERDSYFYGLPGNPKLVARTSADRWIKPQHLLDGRRSFVNTRKVIFSGLRTCNMREGYKTKDQARGIVRDIRMGSKSLGNR
ncbi:hypothetical protein GGR50DRAFT_667665, partial [Xylaria sp. CBS 124048]